MLRVTIELIRPTRKAKPEVVGEMRIVNTLDAEDWPRLGNYTVDIATHGIAHQRVRIEGWEREKHTAWDLVQWALDMANGVVETSARSYLPDGVHSAWGKATDAQEN